MGGRIGPSLVGLGRQRGFPWEEFTPLTGI